MDVIESGRPADAEKGAPSVYRGRGHVTGEKNGKTVAGGSEKRGDFQQSGHDRFEAVTVRRAGPGGRKQVPLL